MRAPGFRGSLRLDKMRRPMLYRKLLRPLLFRLDPEKAHHLALGVLRWTMRLPGLLALTGAVYERRSPRLARTVFGLEFRNPVGLAAGFDKEARVLPALERLGFGFLEVGAISSQGRPGNPRPRIFRLPEDRGLINRMGLPNAGAVETARRLATMRRLRVPLLANIVKTADLEGDLDAMAADYLVTLEAVFPHVDGFTVNVSCPATPELRAFGRRGAMEKLLRALVERRDRLARETSSARKPLILKVSPDIDDEERDVIVDAAQAGLLDGLVLTNTTTRRPEGLRAGAPVLAERGGLSGAPLFPIACERVRWFRERLGPELPIIGVGGIMSAKEARAMLEAGATLIEVYTGFVYEGPAIVRKILAGLEPR